MGHRNLDVFRVLLAAMSLAWLPVFAADDSLGKDLKATIALQGYSCDQIIRSTRNGDSDYTAACKDGHSYHVFVNAQGRVVVQQL